MMQHYCSAEQAQADSEFVFHAMAPSANRNTREAAPFFLLLLCSIARDTRAGSDALLIAADAARALAAEAWGDSLAATLRAAADRLASLAPTRKNPIA